MKKLTERQLTTALTSMQHAIDVLDDQPLAVLAHVRIQCSDGPPIDFVHALDCLLRRMERLQEEVLAYMADRPPTKYQER